ncbi:MAG: nuclear transport factor 2 family protein [Waterburya sp.]
MNSIEVVKELYRAFREQDYDTFLRLSTEDIEWIQNEGFPGGATYIGASAIIEGVFKANSDKWSDFAYHIEEILDAGNSVIVIGKYTGRDRLFGKAMSAAAAHIYDLHDGKIARFRMFADTKSIWNAMTD